MDWLRMAASRLRRFKGRQSNISRCGWYSLSKALVLAIRNRPLSPSGEADPRYSMKIDSSTSAFIVSAASSPIDRMLLVRMRRASDHKPSRL